MRNHFKAALFDLDGVVLDTESQYSIFWGEMGHIYHPDIAHFDQLIKGQTLTQILDGWFATMPEVHEELIDHLNTFEQQMTFPYIAGADAFVQALRNEGVQTAIVTSSNKPKMEQVLRQRPELTTLFDAILTAEDFAASKPDPDCYLRAAAHFQLPASACVVFEDSINGLKAAQASGAVVVGLATTNPRETIRPMADVVIDDFTCFTPTAMQCLAKQH